MKNLLYILLLANFSLAFGQNLIPNGDFELGEERTLENFEYWHEYDDDCGVINSINFPFIDFWSVTGGSPDRLFEGDIPCFWDDGIAQSGKGYALFGGPFQWIPAEAAKTNLITPLLKDSTYHLSYYVKLETFRGFSFEPKRIAFKFNNGIDVITSDFVQDTFWQFRDTVFIAQEDAYELELIGVDTFSSGACVDNIILEKNSTSALTKNIVQNNLTKVSEIKSGVFLFA